MEKVNRKEKSLKVEFSVAIAFTLILVVAASAATIYCCYRLQKYLLPDPNAVILHAKVTMPNGDVREVDKEYRLGDTESPLGWLQIDGAETPDLGGADFSVESVEASFSSLRPKKKLLYRAAGISMVGLPLLYSTLGTIGCAWWFYRNKLAPAIQVLDEAVQHISDQDLDFTVACKSKNELGRLCDSFEKMRQALYENNLQMWRTIEERRTMQASVAHDLRNPLSIMSGYVEYMQRNISSGTLTTEKLNRTLFNLAATTKRMERYTDYIRDLDAIEDTEIHLTEVTLPAFLRDAADSVQVLARTEGIQMRCTYQIPDIRVSLDKEIFYRVLENTVSNAVRYAKESVLLEFEHQSDMLYVRIIDDGKGFSEKMLKKRNSLYYTEDVTGEHMGLGLATGRILCAKHGGGIKLTNHDPHGACVEISIIVKTI